METVAEDTAKLQKETAALSFKREAKKIAIQAASGNRQYANNSFGDRILVPLKDMVSEAENIYQWLIKDVI